MCGQRKSKTTHYMAQGWCGNIFPFIYACKCATVNWIITFRMVFHLIAFYIFRYMNGEQMMTKLSQKLKLIQPHKWMLASMNVRPIICIQLIDAVLKLIFRLHLIKVRLFKIYSNKQQIVICKSQNQKIKTKIN